VNRCAKSRQQTGANRLKTRESGRNWLQVIRERAPERSII
jgi:hypothetical protein